MIKLTKTPKDHEPEATENLKGSYGEARHPDPINDEHPPKNDNQCASNPDSMVRDVHNIFNYA